LGFNNIDAVGTKKLVWALDTNSTLVSMDFSPFSYQDREPVRMAVKRIDGRRRVMPVIEERELKIEADLDANLDENMEDVYKAQVDMLSGRNSELEAENDALKNQCHLLEEQAAAAAALAAQEHAAAEAANARAAEAEAELARTHEHEREMERAAAAAQEQHELEMQEHQRMEEQHELEMQEHQRMEDEAAQQEAALKAAEEAAIRFSSCSPKPISLTINHSPRCDIGGKLKPWRKLRRKLPKRRPMP
jgi:hypothetical protein